MKRVVLVVVCLSVLIIACGSPAEVGDAGKAVQQFYKYLNDGNHDAAFGMYSSEVRQMLQSIDGGRDESFSTWAQTESREGAIDEVKIVAEEVDEGAGEATVHFELNYSSGEPETRIVVLLKEEDRWKLGFIDVE